MQRAKLVNNYYLTGGDKTKDKTLKSYLSGGNSFSDSKVFRAGKWVSIAENNKRVFG